MLGLWAPGIVQGSAKQDPALRLPLARIRYLGAVKVYSVIPRRGRLLALPFCLLSLTSTAAHALSCSDLPPTTVEVTLLETELQTDFRRSYRALKGMTNRYADSNLSVLGLTTGHAVARTHVSAKSLRDRSGQWECSTVQISIQLGYEPLTVLVGREFPQGSCGFREIYAHEMRHADTYRNHARAIVPEIRETLRERFASGDPMRGPAGDTMARLRSELEERWVPYIRRMLERVEPSQRAIDTREEYERVSASCQGEIRRVLGSGKP